MNFHLRSRTQNLVQEEEQLIADLEVCREQEEILWRQKSRVQWLKEGERNTKFFHRAMTHRRYINRITQLEDDQGIPIRDHDQIAEELNSFYKDLLTETNMNREEAIQKITKHIPKLITSEQNRALIRPITQSEVDSAVKEMPPGKAPGPDGFTTDFLPLLLGHDQGRCLAGGRRIKNIWSSSLCSQCNVHHSHPQGGASHTPKTVQTNLPL
jgi:hypothetical protein